MIRFFQSVSIGLIAAVCLLVFSLAGSAQEAKPDFKMDANEFAREVYKDPTAALKKYKGKKIQLTGQAVNASKLYSPRGFGLLTDVKASKLKGVFKSFPIAFEVDLPAELRKEGWRLPKKQKVVVIAELAEVTNSKIRVTTTTFKKVK